MAWLRPNSTGKKGHGKPARLPKMFEQKIPCYDSRGGGSDFEDLDFAEKLKGRSVTDLRVILKSFKGNTRAQITIIRQILLAQRALWNIKKN